MLAEFEPGEGPTACRARLRTSPRGATGRSGTAPPLVVDRLPLAVIRQEVAGLPGPKSPGVSITARVLVG